MVGGCTDWGGRVNREKLEEIAKDVFTWDIYDSEREDAGWLIDELKSAWARIEELEEEVLNDRLERVAAMEQFEFPEGPA